MIKIIYNEVYKLLARKKIYIFMAIILIVSLFSLASALITNGIFKPTNPNADTAMQSQILSSLGRFNGQSFPLTLFGGVMSTILPIFVVILIANMVTDEYTDGSLKLPLLRQVSRNELLIGKLVSLTVVMILMMLFLILLGSGLGTAFFGWGDRFLIKGRAISSSQGFIFTLLIYGSSLISLVSFGMVILLFAVLLDNSGSVVAIGMGILFSSLFLGQVLPETSPYLISSYFNTYELFTSQTGLKEVALGFLVILTYGIGFLIPSIFIFKRKDLLI